ncbi:MAG: hypothetical protein JW737_06920 [Acidobacteria bacterium]|nr:hypothetical protein [Acidobacteriota bacterium]
MKGIIISILVFTLFLSCPVIFAEKTLNNAAMELVFQENDGDENYILPRETFFYMDNEKNIYAMIYKESTILMYDKNGKFISRFGKPGDGPGEFYYPMRLEFEGNTIKIYHGMKISYFTKDWKYIKTEEREKPQQNYRRDPRAVKITENSYLDSALDKESSTVKLYIGKSIDEIETLIEEETTEYEEKTDKTGRTYVSRWKSSFIYTADSKKIPIYGYLDQLILKEFKNGKSSVLTSYNYTKRKIIYENGKPNPNFSDYYMLMPKLQLDKQDNIWFHTISNEFCGLIRLSRDGKETGRFPVPCCDEYVLKFYVFDDYLYLNTISEDEGFKVFKIKL